MTTFSASDWLVALTHIAGVGWQTIAKIDEVCGGFANLPQAMNAHSDELAGRRLRPQTIVAQLKATETRQAVVALKQSNIRTLTVFDAHYPPLLREIAQPPWVLYILGNAALLKQPALAVVGTRTPTPYGEAVAHKLSSELATCGWTVVSGMARGIDSIAHRGALERGGATVAVLGSGVDVVYPQRNHALYRDILRTGAVVSEFPPGTKPHPAFFPLRNRIISGLSRGTVVVEAAARSGSLITADASLEQNRDVFAVPGPITSPHSAGTNRLIQHGAKCVMTLTDILDEYPDVAQPAAALEPQPPEQLTLEETAVLNAITAEPLHVDELCAKTRFTLAEIHPLLLSLLMKRLVKQLPGSRFVRV